MNINPTPPEILEKLYDIAKQKLDFVYLGNIIHSKENHTYCPHCNSMLIRRDGYQIQTIGIEDTGKCIKCGFQVL